MLLTVAGAGFYPRAAFVSFCSLPPSAASPPLTSPLSGHRSSEAALPWSLLGLPGPTLGDPFPEPALSGGGCARSFPTLYQALGRPAFGSSGSAGGERGAWEAHEPPLRDGPIHFHGGRLTAGSSRRLCPPSPSTLDTLEHFQVENDFIVLVFRARNLVSVGGRGSC